MKLHSGTLMAGLVYTGIGVAFVLEALGYWTLRVADLRVIGPLALLVIGLGLIVGTLTRGNQTVR
jgi:hypothetical protein